MKESDEYYIRLRLIEDATERCDSINTMCSDQRLATKEVLTKLVADALVVDQQAFANDPPSTPKELARYRAAREAVREAALRDWLVPGARVKLAGVASDAWNATVLAQDEASSRSTAADMVLLKFDNGNRFPVAIDQIEMMTNPIPDTAST